MDFDWTINITTMLTVGGIAGTGLVAWVTTINRVSEHSKALANLDITIAAINATHKMMAERVEGIRAKSAQELADFKLEVAKSYATHGAIKEVEERVVAAIERLGDRLDKIIDGQRSDRLKRE